MGLIFWLILAVFVIMIHPPLIFPIHEQKVVLTQAQLDSPIRQKFSRYNNVKLSSEQGNFMFNCAYFRNEQDEVLCDSHSVDNIKQLKGIAFVPSVAPKFYDKELLITELIFQENKQSKTFTLAQNQFADWQRYIHNSNWLSTYLLFAPCIALIFSFFRIKFVSGSLKPQNPKDTP